MRICGIDPGLSGGAFVYDTATYDFGGYLFKSKHGAIDTVAFFEWLYMKKPDIIFIEQIFLTGREGGKSATTIGTNYGRLLACMDISHIRYEEIPPKTWQRALGLKGGSRAIVKQSAQDVAVKRFTMMPFLKGKSKKLHDGLTDAACITLYGLQVITEAQQLWLDTKTKSTKSTQSSAQSTDTSAKRKSTSKGKKTDSSKTSKSRSKTLKPKSKASSSKSTQSSAKSKSVGRS